MNCRISASSLHVSEAETEPFEETYKPEEAKEGSVYGTVMIALLGLSLVTLVALDMASIVRSLSLLMYNINVSDKNPFAQNGGGQASNANNHARYHQPLMYSAYYHRRRSMGMFTSISSSSSGGGAASTTTHNAHFRSRPGWNAPPPPKPKKIYIAS